ncbi:MAG: hypothetical protein KKF27_21415 [Gammaproteobacteria bacterium]|nr:hypothetical protein [Gammaproteobacteria bacterium]
MMIHYKETEYGFKFGDAEITRIHSDDKRGWVIVSLETSKFNGNKGLQIYITKTGKIRISDQRGEWLAPKE